MRQLSVLVATPRRRGMLSAQLVFSEGNTDLRWGRTISEAAAFLCRHPDTLIICGGSEQESGWTDSMAYLVESGRPSALVSIGDSGEGLVKVEVRLVGDLSIARSILDNPKLLKAIDRAWRNCKANRAGLLPCRGCEATPEVLQ